MNTPESRLPISRATSKLEGITRKKIHGQWVDVKMISSASCINPFKAQHYYIGVGIGNPCKSITKNIMDGNKDLND